MEFGDLVRKYLISKGNQNISFNICITGIKFHMPNENIHLEGTVSQNCYIGPSFLFYEM